MKTLAELIEEAELIDKYGGPVGEQYSALELIITTAKAVQELADHQHQILHKWDNNNLTIGETTTKPIELR